jgi:acetyl esterase/lipase
MESLQASLLRLIIRIMGFKRRLETSQIDVKLQRQQDIKGLPKTPAGTHLVQRQSGQTPYSILSPLGLSQPGLLIWLHGGAYLSGPSQFHYDSLGKLCGLTGLTGMLVHYPKAPEVTYPTTFAQLLRLYQQVLLDYPDQPLYFLGDSAGGGLALAFTLYLKEQQLPLPKQLFLFSPWLDLILENPGIPALEPKEAMLGVEGLQALGRLYAGENADLRHYQLSPLYGNLTGLPPLYLAVSQQEIFLPDCQKLRGLAHQAGVDITYREFPGLFHDWMIFPLPESNTVLQESAQWIKNTPQPA